MINLGCLGTVLICSGPIFNDFICQLDPEFNVYWTRHEPMWERTETPN